MKETWQLVELHGSGGPTRFTDSAWEQVIPWSEKGRSAQPHDDVDLYVTEDGRPTTARRRSAPVSRSLAHEAVVSNLFG